MSTPTSDAFVAVSLTSPEALAEVLSSAEDLYVDVVSPLSAHSTLDFATNVSDIPATYIDRSTQTAQTVRQLGLALMVLEVLLDHAAEVIVSGEELSDDLVQALQQAYQALVVEPPALSSMTHLRNHHRHKHLSVMQQTVAPAPVIQPEEHLAPVEAVPVDTKPFLSDHAIAQTVAQIEAVAMSTFDQLLGDARSAYEVLGEESFADIVALASLPTTELRQLLEQPDLRIKYEVFDVWATRLDEIQYIVPETDGLSFAAVIAIYLTRLHELAIED